MIFPLISNTCEAIISTVFIIVTDLFAFLIFRFRYISTLDCQYPVSFSDVILVLSLIDIFLVIVSSITCSYIINIFSFILVSVRVNPDSYTLIIIIDPFSVILLAIGPLDLSFPMLITILELSLISAP